MSRFTLLLERLYETVKFLLPFFFSKKPTNQAYVRLALPFSLPIRSRSRRCSRRLRVLGAPLLSASPLPSGPRAVKPEAPSHSWPHCLSLHGGASWRQFSNRCWQVENICSKITCPLSGLYRSPPGPHVSSPGVGRHCPRRGPAQSRPLGPAKSSSRGLLGADLLRVRPAVGAQLSTHHLL